MTELKTLKDLKFISFDTRKEFGLIEPNKYIKEQDLRQEAIKWIKDMAVAPLKDKSWNKAIFVFMEFFNITESELENA